VKLELDELEQKARAAESDEWEWSDGALRGKHNGQVVAYATEANDAYGAAIVVSVSDKQHIAANSPPVTLALIARIHELETGLLRAIEFIESIRSRTGRPRPDPWRVLLEKGAVLP
jgi:hypothetical protein